MTGDNVRQLHPPGPFAGDDAELIAEAGTVAAARDSILAATALEPDLLLVDATTATARRGFAELGGIPVIALDELPGGADLMLAYTVPPYDPPRKAHG